MPYIKNGSASPPSLANQPPTPPPDSAFEKLVQDLSAALGPSSGLDSDDVNPLDIQRLMERYVSEPSEWAPYALGDNSRAYTRNLVDEGNGKSNLVSWIAVDWNTQDQLILVWSPGKGSVIHDHANAHCVMKILKGSLKETLYSWPDQEKVEHGQVSPPQETKQTIYSENQVTYMSDELGLHKISNPDPDNFAISLHLYTPPHAAVHGFSIFDEKTGKAKHINQCNFYSVRGVQC